MNDRTFDTVTRQITAVSRRGSLRALGGAALAGAFAAPAVARAGKAGTKHKLRCKQLGERCRSAVVEDCEGQPARMLSSRPASTSRDAAWKPPSCAS